MNRHILIPLFVLALASSLGCNLLTLLSQPTPLPPTSTSPPTITPAPTTALPPSPPPTSTPTDIPTATLLPPTATRTPAPCSQPSGWTTYTVVRGDTLYSIARRAGSSVAALTSANCLVDASRIEVGQVLFVPGPAMTNTPEQPRYSLEIYLIVANDNGASGPLVGCGDSAILQQTGRPFTRDTVTDLRTALEAMFATQTGNSEQGIVNAFENTPLTVDNVTLLDGAATITLSGSFQMVGTCADARMEAQMLLNVFNFPEVNSAFITINGENMKQMFDMSGQTGPTEPYTRAEAARVTR